MKSLPLSAIFWLACAAANGAEEWLDRLDETLTISAFNDTVRARLSGTIELEAYYFSLPAAGLIESASETLLNPRFTLFLDAQAGSHIYFFAQARLDRGFDPSDGGSEMRLDEYAIRYTPWEDGRLALQIGKFATVVGRWNERHLAWDNPFINAPLPYENVTAVSDLEPPVSARGFATTRITDAEKYDFTPILWGSGYSSGLSVAGRLGKFDYAAELKNASLSSRPESWDIANRGFNRPTMSARLGFRPNPAWTFGLSASRGAYLEAADLLPRGKRLGDYHELVFGQDASFAWHHWQLWAEVYEARFEVPNVGNADTLAYYIEAKYKFTPRFFGALRWNQQFFADVRDGDERTGSWGEGVWRIDAATGYRFTAHTQLKLQYDLGRHDSGRAGYGHLFGAQFMVRF
ncbi:MAG: hypothetical protein JWL90_2151 [Chthoniobacteraceae bacterium]|nr:hypothetical protein [Chthoniobacteraceae bacterium]